MRTSPHPAARGRVRSSSAGRGRGAGGRCCRECRKGAARSRARVRRGAAGPSEAATRVGDELPTCTAARPQATSNVRVRWPCRAASARRDGHRAPTDISLSNARIDGFVMRTQPSRSARKRGSDYASFAPAGDLVRASCDRASARCFHRSAESRSSVELTQSDDPSRVIRQAQARGTHAKAGRSATCAASAGTGPSFA
jgi:hypothetical protein